MTKTPNSRSPMSISEVAACGTPLAQAPSAMRTTTKILGNLCLPIGLALLFAASPLARADEGKEEKKPAEAKEESGADTVWVTTKEGKQIARKGEIVEEKVSGVRLKTGDGEKQV